MQNMRKPLLWTAAILVAVLLIVWVSLLAWLNSSYSRHWVQSRINAAIPGSLSIHKHNFSLTGLRLDLYQVSLHDARGLALAGVEHLFVDCDWQALWRGEIRLEQIRIHAPWADLTVDDSGRLNLISALVPLPQKEKTPSGQTAGTAWPTGIVVEKGQIDGGRFSWRSSGDRLKLEVNSASLLADGDLVHRSGRLALNLADVRFSGADIHPQPGNLVLKAALANGVLTISELTLASGLTRIDMNGLIADLDTQPTIDTLVTVTGHLAELQTVLGLRTDLMGTATARLACKGPLADPTADLTLEVETSSIGGFAMNRGKAALHLHDRQLEIDAAARAPDGGQIRLQGGVDLRGPFPNGFLRSPYAPGEVAYDLTLNAEVPDLSAWLHRWSATQGSFSGQMHLSGKGLRPANLSALVEIKGTGSNLIAPGMQHPMAADLRLTARLNRGRLTVTRFNADSEAIRFSGNGHYEWEGGHMGGRFAVEAKDLASLSAAAGLAPIEGACQATGVVSGSPESLRADLSMGANAIGIDGITIGDIDTRLAWDNGALTVDRLHVKNKGSFLAATGEIQLASPGAFLLLPDPTIAFSVVADHVDPSDFGAAASGQFRIDAGVNGSLHNLSGRLALAGRETELAGQAFESIVLDARLEKNRFWVDRLVGTMAPQQEIRVSGWVDHDRSIDLQVAAKNVATSRIDRLQELLPGKGVLHLTAVATGTLDKPEVKGRLAVSDVTINAEPFDDFSLDFSLHGGLARVTGQLDFGVDAFCNLDKGDFEGRLTFDRTQAGTWFKAAGQPEVTGTVTGRVTAKGNFRDAADITAEMALSQLDLNYEDIPLIRTNRMDARLENQTLHIPRTRISLLSTGNLSIQGDVRIDGMSEIEVSGRVPLAAAGLFIENLHDAAGDLELQATLSGPIENPQVHAQIDLQEIGLPIPGTTQQLHHLNGRIHLTPDKVRIAGLQGSLDTGSFDVAGALVLDRYTPQQVDVEIEFKSLPFEIPDTLAVRVNGGIRLTGSQGAARASGEIVLLEGLYDKDVKIDLVQLATTRQRPTAPPSRLVTVPYFDRVDLDIAISHRQPFAVRNNLAQLEISPDLKIGGTLALPVVSGRAQVTEGTITFQKKTFEVNRGVIDFVDPYRTVPEVDIESQAQIRSWKIFLTVKGTPDNLKFSLTSQPEASEPNLFSLILFGRTAQELAAGEGGAQRTTGQIMAEMLADTFGGDIKKSTGLDILELETNGSSDGQGSEEVKVTVGKRLSDRMTVKYAFETKDGETIQRAVTEYKLLEYILLSGFQENTGNYGSELVFRLEFR